MATTCRQLWRAKSVSWMLASKLLLGPTCKECAKPRQNELEDAWCEETRMATWSCSETGGLLCQWCTLLRRAIPDSTLRVLLMRRLWLPIPPSDRNCRCDLPLYPRGQHRAACATAGSLESAASERVSLYVRVQNMDLTRSDALENRWLETVADGLPLFLGAQLAIDPTLVSVFRRNGTPGPQCANEDGASLVAARRRKEGTYRELTGRDGRTRLVVLACEVGRRWSEEAQDFIRSVARAKARGEQPHLRVRARQAWRLRWATLLACSAARAFALSLLERRGVSRMAPFFFEEMTQNRSSEVSSITTEGAETTTHHELLLNQWRPAEISKNFSTRRGGAVGSRRSSNEDPTAQGAAQARVDPPPEDPRLANTGAQRLWNGASLGPGEEMDKRVRFLRETSAVLTSARPSWHVHCLPHQLWISTLLAASSGHKSCAINLCTPSVRFSVCADEETRVVSMASCAP